MSDLSALLESEASAEIDAILTEARARADEILAAARAEADGLRASTERTAKAQREALLVRGQSSARLEASALRLRARHDAVEGVFAAVAERLDAVASDPASFEPVLRTLLAAAIEAVGAESVTEVVVAQRDAATTARLLEALGVRAPVTAGDVRGGVVVRGRRGSSVEHTLHGRLAALRDELASRVGEVLFGESTPAGA